MSEVFDAKHLSPATSAPDGIAPPHRRASDHAIDARARSDHSGQLAVLTAILATLGAIFGFMSGSTQSSAGLFKNNAVMKTTEAADQWSLYQAKSNKQNLAELALELVPIERKPVYTDEVKRYQAEKARVMVTARGIDDEAHRWNDRSDEALHWHHRWAQATTVLQIAIAVAAIALLTKRRSFEYGLFALSGMGVVLGLAAAMHV